MWEINLLSQCITGGYSLIVGFCFALFYDLFKGYRKVFNSNGLSVFFQDVFVSVIITVFTFLLLIARCNGEIRGYVLVGELLGFWLYRVTLSLLFLKLIIYLYKKIAVLNRLYIKGVDDFSGIIKRLYDKMLFFCKKINKKGI
ncbi:MAG: spore cortex biosynthesis protein YabQ [Acutalibacteraceae bacterium]|nr:spore cortex biosynthesis protein YabQ [Acutalibacteraceae bacterium]